MFSTDFSVVHYPEMVRTNSLVHLALYSSMGSNLGVCVCVVGVGRVGVCVVGRVAESWIKFSSQWIRQKCHKVKTIKSIK